MKRYLITSADERTWKFDRPVIFLGEWCRLYERRHIWRGMDAIVAAPYGLGIAKKDADHAESRAMEEKLFLILCATLNRHHGTDHDSRFWRIVFGHWLRRFTDVIFNRVNTLQQCVQTYDLSGTTMFSGDHYSLSPLDSYSAIWAFNDDRWNNTLYVRILNLLGESSCPIDVIDGGPSEGFRWDAGETVVPATQQFLKSGFRFAGRLASLLARDTDAFIVNSYLTKKEEVKLHLALNQMPQFFVSPALKIKETPDQTLRKKLSTQIVERSGDTTFEIMCSMLFELLPVCYLEGFKTLTREVQQLPWPKRPRFIFTSNNFDTDEIFKIWAAHKINDRARYYVGQHGNYGVTRHDICPGIEEFTSDKFLTWGFRDGLPQHTPSFIFKTAGRKAQVYDPKGKLLLIELVAPHRITTWDGIFEFGVYFSDQFKFVSKLETAPRKDLSIRLHGGHRYARWGELARWRDFDETIEPERGSLVVRKLIAESRLVVHSYDSTAILETLSQNIPTLAFWQNGFDHLRDSAKPYYQMLLNAGIVHLTPESVATKVNEVWTDVEAWWGGAAVQEARRQFCDRYARVSQSPARDLSKTLME